MHTHAHTYKVTTWGLRERSNLPQRSLGQWQNAFWALITHLVATF